MKINQLVEQEMNVRKLNWDGRPKIGCLVESKLVRLYYGASLKTVKRIFKEGIYAKDDGYVLCAAEPNTALLHSIIRILGESTNPSFIISRNEKVVFVIDVPRKYIKEAISEEKFFDKELYESWGKSDVEYYALVDVKIKNHIPVNWIKGYMTKNDG